MGDDVGAEECRKALVALGFLNWWSAASRCVAGVSALPEPPVIPANAAQFAMTVNPDGAVSPLTAIKSTLRLNYGDAAPAGADFAFVGPFLEAAILAAAPNKPQAAVFRGHGPAGREAVLDPAGAHGHWLSSGGHGELRSSRRRDRSYGHEPAEHMTMLHGAWAWDHFECTVSGQLAASCFFDKLPKNGWTHGLRIDNLVVVVSFKHSCFIAPTWGQVRA